MAMATNCEDVSAQMMELLYGELPPDARASVDAHVAGCARCRSELDGFEKTRAVARRGLDEAPPARAHAAIMQAAAAHIAAQARAAERKPAPPERISFWDSIRARWAFPTFATVGAVAVFLVANKVFVNPERALDAAHQRARSTEAPAAAPTGAPPERHLAERPSANAEHDLQPPPVPAASAPPMDERVSGATTAASGSSGRSHGSKASKKPAAGWRADEDSALAKKEEGSRSAFAQPPAAKPASEPAKKKWDDPFAERQFAPPPPPRETQPAAKHKVAEATADKAAAPARAGHAEDPLDRLQLDSAAPKRRAPSTPAKAKSMDDVLARDEEKPSSIGGVGSEAGPRNKADGIGYGSGVAQAAPAPAPVASTPPRSETKKSAPAPAVAAAPTMAPPPPPASPPAQQQRSRTRASSAESASDEGYVAGEAEAKDEKRKAGGKGQAAETLLQRAERLFAAGRWNEAAAAYRELLRIDPRNDDAERWRKRLAVAESADVNQRNANAARARQAAPKASKRAADTSDATE
jgi:anti-sigma factor RsiW